MYSLTVQVGNQITPETVEETAMQLGLNCSLKGSLKTREQNLHWHYKKGKQKGILEITLFPTKSEIVLSFHENRRGEWIEGAIKKFTETLNSQ